jgi:hypothetical protein
VAEGRFYSPAPGIWSLESSAPSTSRFLSVGIERSYFPDFHAAAGKVCCPLGEMYWHFEAQGFVYDNFGRENFGGDLLIFLHELILYIFKRLR